VRRCEIQVTRSRRKNIDASAQKIGDCAAGDVSNTAPRAAFIADLGEQTVTFKVVSPIEQPICRNTRPSDMNNFIARQPIFTEKKDVLGYEILFRSRPENYFGKTTVDASTVAVDNFLLFGIERLTSGRLAFINCSRDFLLGEYLTLLPRDRVVGEILETVAADNETLEACRRLKRAGYQLAVDDFVDSPELTPFLEVADYVKVDFLTTPPAEQERLARKLLRGNVQLLAEKVETQEDVQRGIAMGYRYFQGYFFCRPEMHEGRTIPPHKLNYLRILQIANRPDVDIDELAGAIKQEASLVYRLLRYLNSPIFAFRTKVVSIAHAITLIGERGVRKWISMVSLAAMSEGKPRELVVVPLIRARFCELIAAISRLKARADELFLMGLLSTIDAILDTPMSAVLADIPVLNEIKEALLGQRGEFRDIYEIASNYETGTWEPLHKAVERARVKEELVPELFMKSLDWANQLISFA
jgi:c-di-GMP-related signal transduction protein